jgi:hypothetical protein
VLTSGPSGFSRKALIRAIVDNAAITDPQARAIAAAFSHGDTDVAEYAKPAGQTPVEAALALLRRHGSYSPVGNAAYSIESVEGRLTGAGAHLTVRSPMSVRDARALLAHPDLETLDVTDVSAEVLEVLARLPSLKKLTLAIHSNALYLPGAHGVPSPHDAIKVLASFTKLSELTLGYSSKLDDKALKHLEPMTSLERLTASYTNVTGAGIAASSLGQRLVSLSLFGTRQGSADVLALAKLPHLVKLDLSYTGVSASQVLQLAQSSSLQKVRVSTDIDCADLNKQVGRQLFTTASIW